VLQKIGPETPSEGNGVKLGLRIESRHRGKEEVKLGRRADRLSDQRRIGLSASDWLNVGKSYWRLPKPFVAKFAN
jgi:hypothetical protein